MDVFPNKFNSQNKHKTTVSGWCGLITIIKMGMFDSVWGGFFKNFKPNIYGRI
jgi:hypothetical protein